MWYNANVVAGECATNELTMLRDLLSGNFDPVEFATILIALIVGITIHEFSHAFAADRLGDSLPRRQGRLTLSPLAHLDPVGTLLFLISGFGWGRPVQINPFALRAAPRVGEAIVAVAGPASNILLAAFIAIPLRLLPFFAEGLPGNADLIAASLLRGVLTYNLILAFFNLIPIFPLDGFAILKGLLPADLAFQLDQTRAWGTAILFLLVFAGGGILGSIIGPPIFFVSRVLIGN
ncbi:MAG: site-2 protease family protein [Chloroflexi bacterium]|nr:site-2 protease family protein [Chloroflexota bacterium]